MRYARKVGYFEKLSQEIKALGMEFGIWIEPEMISPNSKLFRAHPDWAIQEGTALLYPLSCIGAHVSACPNHLVGRETPFDTRGHVALAGTFGYELDVTYYRLLSWQQGQRADA